MLLNDFFTIHTINGEANSLNAGDESGYGKGGLIDGAYNFTVGLKLNARHQIFEGHFPGQPVVPGACLLQMVKEVTEKAMDRELRLQKADHLKFIALIDPNEDNLLEMTLTIRIREDEQVSVSASLLNKGAVCFKFSGVFRGLVASDAG